MPDAAQHTANFDGDGWAGWPLSDYAPVAQLDRVPGYEPGGREFESLRARQIRETTFLWHECFPLTPADAYPQPKSQYALRRMRQK